MGQSVLIVIGENLQEEWIRQQIEFKTGCKSEYVVTIWEVQENEKIMGWISADDVKH